MMSVTLLESLKERMVRHKTNETRSERTKTDKEGVEFR